MNYILKRQRENWMKNNKERHYKFLKEKITCNICDRVVSRDWMYHEHRKTKIHKRAVDNLYKDEFVITL